MSKGDLCMSDYLEAARRGKNDWWRYLISFPAILALWLVIGSIPVVLLVAYVSMDPDPATGFSGTGFTGIPVLLEFLVTMSSFLPFLAATFLAVRFIHERPIKTLVTGEDRIRWGRIFAGAGLWMLIAGLLAGVEAALYPGRYVLTFQPLLWLIFAAFAIVLVPIQTSAEEFFFRGYLLQWIGLRLRNIWLLSLINGFLFFLPHSVNPEMAANGLLIGLGYFAMGVFLTLITLQDRGMELALGMHAGNNLFAALFANYEVSSLPSPSIFTVQTLDPVYGLLSLLAGMIVFYAVFFYFIRSGSATRPG
jgi:membrane protease YdiL (CAAX protease family)